MNNIKRTNFRKVELNIDCAWFECDFSTKNFEDFENHLLLHLKISSEETMNNEVLCKICFCTINKNLSALRHMYYHSYHLNLKARGKYTIQKLNHSPCTLDASCCNAIPQIDQPFICLWDKCDFFEDNVSTFYDHIDEHVALEMSKTNNLKPYSCKWNDCNFVSNITLKTHLPSHCEKRYIACPTCGLCFSTTTKFTDHMKRQKVNIWNKNMKEQEISEALDYLRNSQNPIIPLPIPVVPAPKEAYKCNICLKLFVSNRHLHEHKVRHVSTLICPHCPQACSTRYGLKRHILFRHTEEKPFSCTECDRSFKCNNILQRHIHSKHNIEIDAGPFRCDDSPCDYIALSEQALNIHKSKVHCRTQYIVTKVYVCHICNQEYVKGTLLTDHLTLEHGINKIPNKYRHQYKVCEDGKYRLNMFDFIRKNK